MAFNIRRIDYFNCAVQDRPGEAYKMLSLLRDLGVNLLAFTAVPCGPMRTMLTLFPEDSPKLTTAVARSGITLEGPHKALLVQGDDELGAIAQIHGRLYEAGVNVASSNAVTDGRGSYGCIIYVRPEEYEKAASALKV
jgi:hypothetical protein